MLEGVYIGPYLFKYWWMLILLLPLILLGVLYFLRLQKKRHTRIRMPGLEVFEGHSIRGLLRMYVPPVLRLISLGLIIICLARPQNVFKKEEIKGEGIDIMLVIDLSSSMLAKDFKPDRLEASKAVAADFIDKRDFDRIGLVVFSGEAYTQCPPTTDYRMLKNFLSQIRCGVLKDGTAMGMGLATAVNRIKDSSAETKTLVLLTDGMSNAGYYEPIDAANMAKALGVKVYTIGVGTMGDALAPISRRSDGEYIFGPVPVEIDEPLLVQVAEMTGGKYFRAIDNESLEKIYDEIDSLEKTEIEITKIEKRSEAFHHFLMWALGLLALEFILKYTVLRSVN